MANKPNKSKDPTEVALSAIQDALDMREPRNGNGNGMGVGPVREARPSDDDLFVEAPPAPPEHEEQPARDERPARREQPRLDARRQRRSRQHRPDPADAAAQAVAHALYARRHLLRRLGAVPA